MSYTALRKHIPVRHRPVPVQYKTIKVREDVHTQLCAIADALGIGLSDTVATLAASAEPRSKP